MNDDLTARYQDKLACLPTETSSKVSAAARVSVYKRPNGYFYTPNAFCKGLWIQMPKASMLELTESSENLGRRLVETLLETVDDYQPDRDFLRQDKQKALRDLAGCSSQATFHKKADLVDLSFSVEEIIFNPKLKKGSTMTYYGNKKEKFSIPPNVTFEAMGVALLKAFELTGPYKR